MPRGAAPFKKRGWKIPGGGKGGLSAQLPPAPPPPHRGLSLPMRSRQATRRPLDPLGLLRLAPGRSPRPLSWPPIGSLGAPPERQVGGERFFALAMLQLRLWAEKDRRLLSPPPQLAGLFTLTPSRGTSATDFRAKVLDGCTGRAQRSWMHGGGSPPHSPPQCKHSARSN